VYATCLHCHAALGRNEVLEPFPVGRRLAFDAARGRLWVVCLACSRWNLAPLDERWEAIECGERLFRAAPLRYATDHVGLARLRDGTELVRIGPAPRHEMAAWRYGDRLLRPETGRRDRAVGAALALVGRAARHVVGHRAVDAERAAERLALGLAGPGRRADRVVDVVPLGPIARAPGALLPPSSMDHAVAVLRRRDVAGARLVRPALGAPWQLEVPHPRGPVTLVGPAGIRTTAKLLATINRLGVTADVVESATRRVEDAADPTGYFARVLAIALRSEWGRTPQLAHGAATAAPLLAVAAGTSTAERLATQLTGRSFWARGGIGAEASLPLLHLPLADRLALEMAAHEDAERAALEGELETLAAAWREAEEIAAIADAL
jgi:hypothetical protein